MDNIFRQIFWYCRFGYILSTAVKGKGFTNVGNGLRHGYGYTILDAYKLKDGNEILILKNPFGPAEWTGKFNYQDKVNLTVDVKEQVGYRRHSWNDGIFYVSMRDFVENFDMVNVCHYRESHFLSSLPDVINSKLQFAYYQFCIENYRGNKKS